MKVDGTPYEVMLTSSGYHVMVRTQRSAVRGGVPVMLSVSGPFATRADAEDVARKRAAEQVRVVP